VVVITIDHGTGKENTNARPVGAARSANLLVHDAQYIESDYKEHKN
jgi:hypothetical protein